MRFRQTIVCAALFMSIGGLYAAPARAARIVEVSSAGALQRSLENARPGDVIQLADGVYSGAFVAAKSGTAAAPITLQGSRRAVLDGGGVKRGYALHLTADHWVLRGFSITNAQKGLMADGARHNLVDGLAVFHIGDEAIHFRAFSTHNTVQNCEIRDTGVRKPRFGEGVYLGSARSNWRKHSNGRPDASDGNRVINNRFGPDVRAEAIDIKEGSSGGEIRGNMFDGRGMSGDNYADSWVDVKGNRYLIAENRGSRTLRDGFQTHTILDGWGRNNVFRANHADVRAGGLGFRIQLDGDDAGGNIVYSDNTVTQAGEGIANVPLTPADAPSPPAPLQRWGEGSQNIGFTPPDLLAAGERES